MATSPVASAYTFEDYIALDGEQRLELVDGALAEMNPPTVEHFLIAKFIEQALDAVIRHYKHPWLCFREAGIRTGLRRSRLVDVCVVTQDQARDLQGASAVFETPPLLAVEVVSPDSVKRDYRYKRSEYAAIGVPEYWIVDPLTASVSVLTLEEGLYNETRFVDKQPLDSTTFAGLNLTPEAIWAASKV